MMKRSPILLLAGFLLLMGCADSARKRKALDDRSAAILSAATKVEVFRIEGRNDPPDPTVINPGNPTVGGYAILSQGKDQTPEFATRLKDLLSDPRTYSDSSPACFWPGVAFRVWKGAECMDIIICFTCGNLYLGPPTDERVLENSSFGGSPNTNRLIRLAKDAFPGDPEIQALAEK